LGPKKRKERSVLEKSTTEGIQKPIETVRRGQRGVGGSFLKKAPLRKKAQKERKRPAISASLSDKEKKTPAAP